MAPLLLRNGRGFNSAGRHTPPPYDASATAPLPYSPARRDPGGVFFCVAATVRLNGANIAVPIAGAYSLLPSSAGSRNRPGFLLRPPRKKRPPIVGSAGGRKFTGRLCYAQRAAVETATTAEDTVRRAGARSNDTARWRRRAFPISARHFRGRIKPRSINGQIVP